MAFNLRLPPDLDSLARAKSEGLGISLNALICVALGEYLKPKNEAPRMPFGPPVVVAEPVLPVPTSRPPAGDLGKAPVPGQKPSKAERRAITAQIRLARKA